MLYHFYDMNHAAFAPARALAEASLQFWQNDTNPLAKTPIGRTAAASLTLFERATRRFSKPAFNIGPVTIAGQKVAVREDVVLTLPFCRVLHFAKVDFPAEPKGKSQPKLLIVAPMSGHYATLLRSTVETMLPDFDVYITDWVDARMVSRWSGKFDLDDYVDYLIKIFHHLAEPVSVMAVCQPSVPVLAAVALMNAAKDPLSPNGMILMGGPVDTRRNPTAVNLLAKEKGVDWFRDHVIMTVPFPHPGAMRRVYPGFLQLTGFMTMNLDRHMTAHRELFWHLVQGDGDGEDKHAIFYDEYMSVMDLTEEFYLQTVERVFIDHALPKGTYRHRGNLIDCGAITQTALLTIEGERDDISGVGQTEAAHDLCSGLSPAQKQHHLQLGVGHYGVFSGSKFRQHVAPIIGRFIAQHRA
jgi:poly(3-hydroxybutyrate) depolymerase